MLVLVTVAGLLVGLLAGRGAAGLAPGSSGSLRPTIVVESRSSPVAVTVAPSAVSGPAASPPAEQEYTVEPGDTLQTIAQRVYGDPDLWQRIYAANRDLIGPNPDALQAGTRLRIPAG